MNTDPWRRALAYLLTVLACEIGFIAGTVIGSLIR